MLVLAALSQGHKAIKYGKRFVAWWRAPAEKGKGKDAKPEDEAEADVELGEVRRRRTNNCQGGWRMEDEGLAQMERLEMVAHGC
ncbi:hypothetical protein PG984_016641 [Apiospora sp. TS-2023a]